MKRRKEKNESDSESDEDNKKNSIVYQLENKGKYGEAKQIAASYKFKTMDPREFPPNCAVYVLGKRGYGKTTFIHWWFSERWFYYPSGIYVFTKTKFNRFYTQFVPDSRIYTTYRKDVILALMARQKQKYDKIVQNGEKKGEELVQIAIIFDDFVSDEDIQNDPLLEQLILNGRHLQIHIVFASQDIKGFAPILRGNMDLVATTYQSQERTIDTLRNEFGDFFKNNDVFREILKLQTQNRQMFFINQTLATFSAEEAFSVATANPEPEPFKVGDKKFWKESGCSWKEQLKFYKNIEKAKHSTEEWLQIGLNNSKKNKRPSSSDNEEEQQEEYGITVNQSAFANEPIQQERKKSNYQEAIELINDPKKMGILYKKK